MHDLEVVRRLTSRRYAGAAALGILMAAAVGAGIALAQPKQVPIRPAVAPSPAVPPTDAGIGPREPVKAPPPFAAAFDGTPPAAHPAVPQVENGQVASPPPPLPPVQDPVDK
jgi:hypothetical protein